MSAAHPLDGRVRFAVAARPAGWRFRPVLLALAGAAATSALAMTAVAWLWPHFPPLDWEASAPLWVSAAWIAAAAALGAWILARKEYPR